MCMRDGSSHRLISLNHSMFNSYFQYNQTSHFTYSTPGRIGPEIWPPIISQRKSLNFNFDLSSTLIDLEFRNISEQDSPLEIPSAARYAKKKV